MSSNSETGHAINIANLKILKFEIQGIGPKYNPTNLDITIAGLTLIYDASFAQQALVNSLLTPYSNAVNDRQILFEPLNRLLTKLYKAYKATPGVTEAQLENFMTIARKIKGLRKKKHPKNQAASQHSVSQLSYDMRTNHLDQLIELLRNTAGYNPNEIEYKVATLQAMYEDILAKTAALARAYVNLNNARTIRNTTLYSSPNNLVDTAYKAKDYVYTILDVSSAQYKAISKIKFSRI